jgi:hypothetical protein
MSDKKKELNLPRVPVPKPQQAFKTRKDELDRKMKHKGRRFDECMQMDIVKRWEEAVTEDAPANSAGGGGVAGIGIGPKGEPGVDLRKKRLDDMKRDAHLNEDADFERRMKATAAYEDAMDAVLHDDYGNFMELLMVTREMADDGDKKAIAKIEQMTALLKKAKAAGEAARAKVLKEAVEDTQRPELKGLNKSYFDIGKKDGLTDRQRGKTSRPKASLSHDKDYVSGYQEGFKSETGKLNVKQHQDVQRYKWLSHQLANFDGISPMGTFMTPLHQTKFETMSKEYKKLRSSLKEQRILVRTIKLPQGLKEETFAGAQVFEVDMDKVMKSRFGKNRYHRYSRYVGEDEKGEEIRQHGRDRKSGDIILKDSKTAVMTYLRRKKPVGQ